MKTHRYRIYIYLYNGDVMKVGNSQLTKEIPTFQFKRKTVTKKKLNDEIRPEAILNEFCCVHSQINPATFLLKPDRTLIAIYKIIYPPHTK